MTNRCLAVAYLIAGAVAMTSVTPALAKGGVGGRASGARPSAPSSPHPVITPKPAARDVSSPSTPARSGTGWFGWWGSAKSDKKDDEERK
jgi:hypothetical protein